jgi:hypothetical protein
MQYRKTSAVRRWIGTINHVAKRCFLNRWDMVKIKSGKGESVRIVCDDPRMLITLEYTSKDTVLDVTWYYQAKVYGSLHGICSLLCATRPHCICSEIRVRVECGAGCARNRRAGWPAFSVSGMVAKASIRRHLP